MANDYIKSAVNRYKESFKEEKMIHPISEMDVRIINELRKFISKTNLSETVLPILDNYKFEKDEDILGQLKELNNFTKPSKETVIDKLIDFAINDVKEEEEKEKDTPFYLEVQNSFIAIGTIFGLDSVDDVEYDGSEEDEEYGGIPVYKIIINPLHEKDLKNVPPYADFELLYYEEEERNKELERIKTILDKVSKSKKTKKSNNKDGGK